MKLVDMYATSIDDNRIPEPESEWVIPTNGDFAELIKLNNNSMIEDSIIEKLKEGFDGDKSYHSGVNDGMYALANQVNQTNQVTISSNFRIELEALINNNSVENSSNTPDFILAEYLNDCLLAFDKATNARVKWYKK